MLSLLQSGEGNRGRETETKGIEVRTEKIRLDSKVVLSSTHVEKTRKDHVKEREGDH